MPVQPVDGGCIGTDRALGHDVAMEAAPPQIVVLENCSDGDNLIVGAQARGVHMEVDPEIHDEDCRDGRLEQPG